MTDVRIEMLRKMPIFGGIRPETLEMILQVSDQVDVHTGECFFRQGDPAQSLFVLRHGSVTVERDGQGRSIQLGTLGAGDCVGEMSLIDFMPRSATVRAKTPCQAIEVPSQSMITLLKKDLEQYTMLMMNLGREVSRRLRSADDRLFELQQNSESTVHAGQSR